MPDTTHDEQAPTPVEPARTPSREWALEVLREARLRGMQDAFRAIQAHVEREQFYTMLTGREVPLVKMA